jgi:threonylcarbamoyladenosine tRNA methylthiotransferase MtaB
MKYIITTLGCKVNQYETQAIETILNSDGHFPAGENEKADCVIVNTCAVTAESGRKSRQAIRKLSSEYPDAVIAVGGCYSQLSPEDVKDLGAKVVFGSSDRGAFVQAIERAVESGENSVSVDDPFKRKTLELLPSGAVSGRTRAMLKIQDGCVNFCSYCIIPYTRGRILSLPAERAVSEAKDLAEKGYREIVLTGIEIASYGLDLKDRISLKDIVFAVSEAVPDVRIRLGSIEPTAITEDFCRTLSKCRNLCPHFHLSLQSGCDRTLEAMKRKYTTGEFAETVKRLRYYFPGCALTADLITGFPGETEEDHRTTLEFIKSIGFSAMHVFPYSRRPGTPADKMPDQISQKVKNRRAKEAAEVAGQMQMGFIEEHVGKEFEVLFENEEDSVWQGHSADYILCKMKGKELHGRLLKVRAIKADKNCLLCEEVR